VDARGLHFASHEPARFVFLFDDLRFDEGTLNAGVGRHLTMLPSPQQLDLVFEAFVELSSAVDQRRTEQTPGDRHPDEDQSDCHEPAKRHVILLSAISVVSGFPLSPKASAETTIDSEASPDRRSKSSPPGERFVRGF
jgi:hypothetical protein